MQPMRRIQDNVAYTLERRFVDWACRVMPKQVTADHLTMFGVFGAVVVFTGYLMSRSDPEYLWLAAGGYAINWLGDSLDGSLARHRRMTRPRYGYFVDHSCDAFCFLTMIGGLGLTDFVRLDAALLMVVGYFALSIHVFLRNHVTGTFQPSFLAIGQTELRLGCVAFTLWMYAQGVSELHFGTTILSQYDLLLIGIGLVFLGAFAHSTLSMILDLRAIEGDGRRHAGALRPASLDVGTVGVKDAAAY